MRKQDNLVQLINTLSPNEKRYFKLFNNIQPGEKRYMQLFDALIDKDHYDAEALEKELGLNSTQLKSDKYYLNNNLLRSVSSSDDISVEIGLYRNYLEVHSLLERRLFSHALEFVEKCMERSKRLELFYFLPNFIVVKQNCLYGLQRHEEVAALTKEFNNCQLAAAELFEITQLRYDVIGLERQRREDDLKNIIKHALVKTKPEKLKSLRARIAWYDIITRHSMFFDPPANFVKLMKAEVTLYEKSDNIKEIDPISYVHSYAKVAKAEMKSGNPENALIWYEKFGVLLDSTDLTIPNGKLNALRTYGYYNQSMALRFLGRFGEALPLAEKAFRELAEGYPYEHYSYAYEYILCLAHTGQPKEAAAQLDTLLQLKTEMRSDIQNVVRPLMMLIQYDLGNKSLIPYLIKSAKAWLKRKNKPAEYAETFFSFMYALAKADRTSTLRILTEFRKADEDDKLGYCTELNMGLNTWIQRQIDKNKRQ